MSAKAEVGKAIATLAIPLIILIAQHQAFILDRRQRMKQLGQPKTSRIIPGDAWMVKFRRPELTKNYR